MYVYKYIQVLLINFLPFLNSLFFHRLHVPYHVLDSGQTFSSFRVRAVSIVVRTYIINKMRMSMVIPKPRPLLHIPAGRLDMQSFCPRYPPTSPEKVVVVLGATGTGKSRLSIELATRFPSEIVNSDKMQVYKGLDIVTNKITDEESRGVPHHLLGVIEDPVSDFTAKNFCTMATAATNSISSRGKLPLIVGGSNSFIEALIDDDGDDDDDVEKNKFECCFLWVDVAMPVLKSFVSERVDRMVEKGLVEEVRKMFSPDCRDYSKGIMKSIGVPEFDRFFRTESLADEETRTRLLEEAINETKKNTWKLANRQREKITRLRFSKGWKIHRLDATDVFIKSGEEADKAWDNLVVGPSTMIVSQFLHNHYSATTSSSSSSSSSAIRISRERMMETAVHVAVSH